MTISVRLVDSDKDYEAWRQVRIAVLPNERVDSAESLRAQAGPQLLFLLAEVDGVLAGSGMVGKSQQAGRGAMSARVLPDWRRRGVGTAILRDLAERAAGLGFTVVGSNVDDPGSVEFAERFGFREVDRQVEQVREIGDEPAPKIPDGVEVVRVSQRPELWPAAYDVLAPRRSRTWPWTRRWRSASRNGSRSGSPIRTRCSSPWPTAR